MFLPFSEIVGKLIEAMLARLLPRHHGADPWDDQDRKNVGTLAILLALFAGAVVFLLLGLTALIVWLAQ